MMTEDNLIESWLAVELIPGMTIAQAIRDMNCELYTRYTPHDLGKWRRGDRPIPQPVQNYMMQVAICHALGPALDRFVLYLDDEDLDLIVAKLRPPPLRRLQNAKKGGVDRSS